MVCKIKKGQNGYRAPKGSKRSVNNMTGSGPSTDRIHDMGDGTYRRTDEYGNYKGKATKEDYDIGKAYDTERDENKTSRDAKQGRRKVRAAGKKHTGDNYYVDSKGLKWASYDKCGGKTKKHATGGIVTGDAFDKHVNWG